MRTFMFFSIKIKCIKGEIAGDYYYYLLISERGGAGCRVEGL